MLSPEEKQAVIDLFPFLPESPVVFDVGSNKGHWTDVILDEFKDRCTIHLFEPNQKLLSFTEIKYEYNKNIIYHNRALSNDIKERDFFYFENFNNEISSLYDGGDDWKGLPIIKGTAMCMTGDNLISKLLLPKVDYIKIDCEGADFEVLQGLEQSLREDKVGIVQIEYSFHWKRGGYKWNDLKLISDKYGYKIYRYIENNFWEVTNDAPEHDNYFITKFEIHNYCISGSNANFILNTADLPKMDLILEIGAMEGVTTRYMCNNLLNKENSDARVIVVDPLYDYYVTEDPRYHPEFKHQYQRFKRITRGLPVELKRGESEHELPKLNAMRFDFIFVDGNHYAPWPYHDLCWAFAITKIGGYILADDYDLWADDTKASIDKFLTEFQRHYEVVQKNYQILIKKTSNHYNQITQSYYL